MTFFTNILFFWFVIFIVVEILLSNNYEFVLTNFFFFIIFTLLYLIFINFNFLVYVLFAVYSSSFLILSLFLFFFKRFWDILKSSSSNISIFFLFLFCFVLFNFNFFLWDFKNSIFFFIFNFIYYDVYSLKNLFYVDIAVLHNFFYKWLVFESVLLNVFLLVAFMAIIFFLLFVKFVYDANSLNKFISLKKNIKSLYFFKNNKILATNKLKRQIRRSSSSIIKFKK